MEVGDIIKKIEEFAPQALACTWDNPGLLCGDKNREVKKILISLDVNLETVLEAIDIGADMIVAHHPLFFSGLKKIDLLEPEGKTVELLIKNDIAVFAAHTNMDAAENGINERLAKIFELSDISILEPVDEKTGIGRIGCLKEKISAEKFCEVVKEKLNTPFVRLVGGGEIRKLAICSGSGAEYLNLALKNGCDALLTGDVKYHSAISAKESGITIIDAGHFPTEKLVCDIFEEILSDLPLTLIKSKSQDVFKIM